MSDPSDAAPDDPSDDDTPMTVRETTLEDGRYELFFTFGDDV